MDSAAIDEWIVSRCGAHLPPDAQVYAVQRGERLDGVVVFSHWYAEGGQPYDAEWTLEMDRPATPAIIRASLRYAFKRLGLRRLTVHPRTDQSRRLAEWIGFRYEGERRDPHGPTRRLMYGLTADEYRASRWAPS